MESGAKIAAGSRMRAFAGISDPEGFRLIELAIGINGGGGADTGGRGRTC